MKKDQHQPADAAPSTGTTGSPQANSPLRQGASASAKATAGQADGQAGQDLRRRAEKRLKRQKPEGGGQRTEVETAQLVHELEVHQIELEMQNEELQQAHGQTDALLAQYTDLYDFAPTGYMTLDRKGAIRQVNLTGARLLGVERSRLVNRRFDLFVADGDRRAFSDFLQKVFASQAKECCEVTLPQEGSQPLVVRIEGTRSEGGQECRAVALDITERRRAEDIMAAEGQQLRKLNEVKSQFVANASHELRTPLAIIRQFIYLMDSGIAGPLADKQKECARAALRNCDRLAELVNRMLDLARIEAGKVHIDPSRIEPGLLLNQSYTDFVGKVETKKQRLVLKTPDDLPAVSCDPQSITSVIMELLGNAYKFTPEGGKITLGCRPEGQFLSVYVEDEGPGIPLEDQERIFEAFTQVDRQDGAGAKGTGLGLTIIREIVKLHGGSISVASTQGKGSRFSFTIPVYDKAKQLAHRVLVVDDDEGAVKFITRSLKHSGLDLEVKSTSSGLQALVIATQFHPDLIILDVYLPDSGPADILASLKKEPAEKHGKVLMISGDEDALKRLSSRGADDYLAKPFSNKQLLEKVVTLLGIERKGVMHVGQKEDTAGGRRAGFLFWRPHAVGSKRV